MDKTVYPFKYWCFLWQLLIHVEQGDTRGLSIIHPLGSGRKRRGETHESLILDSCCMLNYSSATMQVKAEEESITVYRAAGSATAWELDLVIPSQWQLINMDPVLLICCLWPTTITNSSIIAMTIMVPIHTTSHQRRRRRNDGKWRRGCWLSLSCALFHTLKHTSASSCSVVLWYRQWVQPPY